MKRRIAIISDHASPFVSVGGIDCGGQNVYVDHVARNLVKLGYEVDVFTRWDNVKLPKLINYRKGIRVVHVEAGPKKFIPKEKLLPYAQSFYSDLLALILQDNPEYDLIHANFFISAEVAIRLKRKLGIPVVITFHALGKVRKIFQGASDRFPVQRMRMEQRAIEEADHIIAECPQDMEDLLFHYHADRGKISIVPCGFDPAELFPIDKKAAKAALGLDLNTSYLLQLGRMVPRKGVDTALYALARLFKNKSMRVKLLIAGGASKEPDPLITPEIGRLQAIARNLRISDKVVFVGQKSREQLKYYYSAADIFISTPWYEPFGITPLEAMACGTPVIGSNVGGIKFSVIDGKTGYLVPAKDPVALAQKIENILSDNRLAKHLSVNAIKRVNSFFTWNTVTEVLAAVFEKVIYSHSVEEEYQLYNRMAGADSE